MRVITGIARGARLTTLEGNEVRPTTEKVKEAMFSAIQFLVPEAKVLDLFCGSGQLGIDALSLGAAFCTFVDAAKASADVTTKNLKKTGFDKNSRVMITDAGRFLARCHDKYDIIIADPPYKQGIPAELLPQIAAAAADGAAVVLETEKKCTLPAECGRLRLQKNYQHGAKQFWLYRADYAEEE